MIDYQAQANEFMVKTGTTMSLSYRGCYPFFSDDKESRDVYEITFVRKGQHWSLSFGQSLADTGTRSVDRRNLTKEKEREYLAQGYKRSLFTLIRPKVEPTAYDVLACITKEDPGTFDDFCANYGYSTDSRFAEQTYFAVQKEFDNVRRMFGDVLSDLQEIS